MKKILSVILAVVMLAAAFTATASAAENSNHYIEPDYPSLNKKETAWEVYGWTVVDTEITKIGYILDEGETVWAVPTVDVRDDNSRIEANDAFRDIELEAAIVEYSLTNGLDDFFGYRIYLTIDTSELAKGKHIVEVVAAYADESEDNPFRGEIFSFTKKKGPATEVTTEAAATEPATVQATEKTTEAVTEPATVIETEKATEAAPVQTDGTENAAKPENTSAETEKPAEENKNNALPIILIIVAAVIAFAVGGFFILKKKK